MDAFEKYPKAPITEAILDIQVEAASEISLEALARCQEAVRNDYPSKRVLTAATAHLSLEEPSQTTSSSTTLGYAFVSSDGKQLFQVQKSGFAANRLAPYTSWESFSAEARRLWGVYRNHVTPTKLTRIALRYINRIDLPQPVSELKDYFNTTPEIARGLPQMLSGFFMQVLVPFENEKAYANIVQTIAPSTAPQSQAIILDIDLFRGAEISNSENELWETFEVLRVVKNFVFQCCITEKTRELFR